LELQRVWCAWPCRPTLRPWPADFTVQVTAIMGEHDVAPRCYAASRVGADGHFTVFGPPGEFFWHAYGRRAAVEVEPLKAAIEVRGEGPYRYIV
jgi:hypothetical protein